MRKPSKTPEEQLQRILSIAKTNGTSIVVISSLGTLLSIGDWLGMAVGLGVLIGGSMELKGRKQLIANVAAGMRMLVRSQWVVLGVIEFYCLMKLGFDRNHGVSPEMRLAMADLGIDMKELEPSLRLAFYGTYGAVALLTIIYQGGMARYYGRRTAVVQQAIADRLRPPAAQGRAGDPEDWVT